MHSSGPRSSGRRLAPVHFRPGRRRRWPRRILVMVNIVVAAAIVSVASAYGYLNIQLNQINKDHIGALAKTSDGRPFTMLIVGSDTRSIPGGQAFGGGSATPGQRSDTIILARVVPATRQITLMSIPRDLYVPIQGIGQDRINSAFNSGPNLLVQTIETDLGIPINHYVEVNFDSFRDVTSAVGGVHFWFPTPARDYLSDLVIPQAGCVLLTGNEALGFVRSRHYQYYSGGAWHDEAASDLARIQRQQAFIKRLVNKAQGQFTNPLALNDIVSGITKNLTLDSGFSEGLILSLARTFRGVSSTAIPSATLPTSPTTTNGGAQVLTLQEPDAGRDIAAFNQLGNTSAGSASGSSAPGSAPPSVSPPAHAPDPSSVTVEVVNGSGVPGQAGQATTAVSALGYQTTTITSSRAYAGTANEVHYAPDSMAAAQALASHLRGGAVLTMDPSLTPTSFNLELITGAGYAGTGQGPAPTTTTTPSPVTTAPAPAGTSVAAYRLPGTPPGQVPPASCKP